MLTKETKVIQMRKQKCWRFIFSLICLLNFSAVVNSMDSDNEGGCDVDKNKCMNGGSCIEGVAQSTGKSIQVCDCQNAFDEEGNRFIGLHCEVQALMTEVDCYNGGTPNTSESGIIFCECPDGYAGAYCELSKDASEVKALLPGEKEECNIPCSNGGICALGRRDPTTAESDLLSTFDPNDHEYFYEHCKCPDGFYGANCESAFEKCDNDDGNGEYYCHNNSTCIKGDNADRGELVVDTRSDSSGFWAAPMCDCTPAHRPGKHFTGKYCELENLVTCKSHTEDIVFCTNGGSCLEDDDGHWSCDCPEGFKGIHCEEILSKFLTSDATSKKPIKEDNLGGISTSDATTKESNNEEDNFEFKWRCNNDDRICQNGGKCGGGKCHCATGYFGFDCNFFDSALYTGEEIDSIIGEKENGNTSNQKDKISDLTINGDKSITSHIKPKKSFIRKNESIILSIAFLMLLVALFVLMASVTFRGSNRNDDGMQDRMKAALDDMPTLKFPGIKFPNPKDFFGSKPAPDMQPSSKLNDSREPTKFNGRRRSFLEKNRFVRSNSSRSNLMKESSFSSRNSFVTRSSFVSSPYMTREEEKALTELL